MQTPSPTRRHGAVFKRRVPFSALMGGLSGALTANRLPHLYVALTSIGHASAFGNPSSPALSLAWALANLMLAACTALHRRARLAPLAFAGWFAAGLSATGAVLAWLWP